MSVPAFLLAGQVAQEVAAHELLGQRGAALREDDGGREPLVAHGAAPRRRGGRGQRLPHHAREGAVVDAGVREEVLVLRGQDGLAHDGRDFFVFEDPPVLARELDEHLAAGIGDLADGRGLEPHERLQVGHLGTIGVEVVGGHAPREQEDGDREPRRCARRGERSPRALAPGPSGRERAPRRPAWTRSRR